MRFFATSALVLALSTTLAAAQSTVRLRGMRMHLVLYFPSLFQRALRLLRPLKSLKLLV